MNVDDAQNDPPDPLAVHARVSATSQAAARRFQRKYMIGLGIIFSLWLVVLAVVEQRLSGTATRAVAIGGAVALLVVAATLPARLEPVRARLGRRAAIAGIVGGSLLFAVFAALAAVAPSLTLIGAVVVLAYWVGCAFWLTRGDARVA